MMMETMTLGDLRRELAKCPPDALLVYRDFGMVWGGLDSWRGSYAEPAIGYSTSGDAPTVASVLAEIDEALGGKVFTGYKGGEFTYDDASPVHVDNYGECHSNVHLVGVELLSTRWACLVVAIDRED